MSGRQIFKSEAGFTLIEAMVAALILVVAGVALSGLFINSSNEASAEVQQNQLINIADQQVEQVRADVAQLGFASLAMTTAPSAQVKTPIRSTWADPDQFVETDNGNACFEVADNYDNVNVGGSAPFGSAPEGFTQWSSCGASSNAEPLAVLSGGFIGWRTTASPCSTGGTAPTFPCTVALPGTGCTLTNNQALSTIPACAVTVFAYVSYTYVGCATAASAGASGTGAACPAVNGAGTEVVVPAGATGLPTSASASTVYGDARRLTVAVVPNVAHRQQRVTPLYLSTIFTNPSPSTTGAAALGLKVQAGL